MSRREVLKGLRFPGATRVNRGLWLDRFLESSHRDDTESKRHLVQEAAQEGEPEGYAEFFQRYRQALVEAGAEVREAHTLGRLVVGLGGEGVLETSLTLHRTYGVPYLPGSALKGLASRYAHLRLEGEAWRRDLNRFHRGEAQAALFGTTEEQGLVVFFDALPLPGKWKLRPDIMNPHHADYYGGGTAPPADWDSPVPVPFLSVTGTFLLGLAPAPGVDREAAKPWLRAAWQILAWALREEGVGAKTSSGYGRMELAGALPAQAEEGKDGGKVPSPEYERLATRLRSVSYQNFRGFLEVNAEAILGLSEEELAGLRQALEAKGFLKTASDLKRWAKESPRLKEVLEKLRG